MSNEPTPEPLSILPHPNSPTTASPRARPHPRSSPRTRPSGASARARRSCPDSPEKHHHGRFSEGQEELPEEDPEKHEERRFSEGQDHQPPGVTP